MTARTRHRAAAKCAESGWIGSSCFWALAAQKTSWIELVDVNASERCKVLDHHMVHFVKISTWQKCTSKCINQFIFAPIDGVRKKLGYFCTSSKNPRRKSSCNRGKGKDFGLFLYGLYKLHRRDDVHLEPSMFRVKYVATSVDLEKK